MLVLWQVYLAVTRVLISIERFRLFCSYNGVMKIKAIQNVLITTIATLSLSSCATIVAGGSPKITIDGDTKEPVTIITEKQTYPDVQLPYTVQVNRHHISGQRVQIKSANKAFRDVVLEKKVNSWTWGNILLGGLPGWGIDLITNCVATPSKSTYFIEEKAKE